MTQKETRKQKRTLATAKRRNWKRKFVEALAKCPNVSYACEKAGVDRVTVYKHKAKDPEFARRWEEGMDAGVDGLENAMYDRARNGVKRGVWKTDENGRPKRVETVREFPEGTAQFLMKAHRPARFRDPAAQVNTQVNVAVDARPMVQVPEARLRELVGQLASEPAQLTNGNGNGHARQEGATDATQAA